MDDSNANAPVSPVAIPAASAPLADTATAAPNAAAAVAQPAAPVAAALAVATPDPVMDLDAGDGWGSKNIVLMHPFKLKGVVYTAIDVRCPTGLDLTRYYSDKKGTGIVDAAIQLSSAAGAPINRVVFAAMRSDDAQTLVEAATSFLFGASATSTAPSTTSA